MKYLQSGRYAGVDPCPEFVEIGRGLVRDAGLEAASPTLGTLELLEGLEPHTFDFVLTQSVLNHLDADGVVSTVLRVSHALGPNGLWVSTGLLDPNVSSVEAGAPHPTRPGERLSSTVGTDWFISRLAGSGLVMSLDQVAEHPRGLTTFVVRHRDSGFAAPTGMMGST